MDQVGVKAPGREKSTTFLPTLTNILSWEHLYIAHVDMYNVLKFKRRILNFKYGPMAVTWRGMTEDDCSHACYFNVRQFLHFLNDEQISFIAEDFAEVKEQKEKERKRKRDDEEIQRFKEIEDKGKKSANDARIAELIPPSSPEETSEEESEHLAP